jgi:hypothetical protein
MRGGRARLRRRLTKLYTSQSSQSRRRSETLPVTVNVRVFVADSAPLPNPGAVPALAQAPFGDPQSEKHDKLKLTFREHVERWKNDTQHWSSVAKMIAHPSYLRIIGLASHSRTNEVERWLLQELQLEPDYWFDALTALAGEDEDPVQPQDDFDGAVNAWLAWGHRKGFVNY